MQCNNVICLRVIHTIIGNNSVLINRKKKPGSSCISVQEQFFKLNWSEKWASVVRESVNNQFLLCQTKHVSGTCFPTLLSFFPLLPESKRTDMYGDIITKFSWMDRLPNYLNNGALFVRASQVRVELHYKLSPQKVVDYTRSGHLWDVQFKGFHYENFVVWRQWSLLYIWTSLLSFLLLLKLKFTSTS